MVSFMLNKMFKSGSISDNIPSKQWGKKPLRLVCILLSFSPLTDRLNGYVANREENIHVALE